LDPEYIKRINGALEETQVLGIRASKDNATVELLLQVTSLPEEGPIDPDGRRRLVLRKPSSVMILLRPDHAGESRYGPPIPLADLEAVENFFADLTSGDAMYSWPFIDGSEHVIDDWPQQISLTMNLSQRPGTHSIYWFSECGWSHGGGQSFFVQGLIRFEDIDVLRADGEQVLLDQFIEDSNRAWSESLARGSRMSTEAQHAAQIGTPKWRAWQMPNGFESSER
jgi:hypothetical protein